MIRIFSDREALSKAAAEIFADEALRAVQARGCFSVLLAGGDTPRLSYELLARAPLRDRIPWKRVHVFWGDERCVLADDPRSNVLMARRALLDHIPIPPSQVHPILCAADPELASADYEKQLRSFFADRPPRFDLVFLGLGADGHTASLFPGAAPLDEDVRWTAVARRPDEDIRRITLTLPVINNAALILFLVAGTEKAGVLREVLEGGEGQRRVPASLIRPTHGQIHWLVDHEAASCLRNVTQEDFGN